jgi:FemAB-related protein (PEP-CTERM system-associated)
MNAPSAISVTVRAVDLRDTGDRARVDAFVLEHPDSTLFHRPQWTRAAERGCGQESAYLVAERAGTLVGCLPLTKVRSRLFGKALVSSGFATGGGILAESGAVAARLADAAWQLAAAEGFNSVELRGGPVPEGWAVKEGTYSNFDRGLPSSEDELLKSIPRRQRAEIRKALGFELEVTNGCDFAQLEGHFRVYSESVRNLGTPVFPRALFKAAVEEFGDSADIALVSQDGRPLAAMLWFEFKGICQPYWGGGTADAKKWRANDLVYFETMRRGIERGCTRTDFGRSKVGTGPWARKKIWGFEETPLIYGLRTAHGAAAREINPMSPKYRLQVAAWQRMPLWVANRLGPIIARGLG